MLAKLLVQHAARLGAGSQALLDREQAAKVRSAAKRRMQGLGLRTWTFCRRNKGRCSLVACQCPLQAATTAWLVRARSYLAVQHDSAHTSSQCHPQGSSQAASLQVVACLLAAYFHPAAEAAPGLCQMLSVFFPAFAQLGPGSAELLSLAALPAARQAAASAPATGTATQKGPAPRLLQYVLQRIQAGPWPLQMHTPKPVSSATVVQLSLMLQLDMLQLLTASWPQKASSDESKTAHTTKPDSLGIPMLCRAAVWRWQASTWLRQRPCSRRPCCAASSLAPLLT